MNRVRIRRPFRHWASLNEEGMELFGDAFPDKIVPVVSMIPMWGPLGSPESPPQSYFLVQWDELEKEAQEILLELLSERFGSTQAEVLAQIAEVGLPLRRALTNSSGSNHPGFFY